MESHDYGFSLHWWAISGSSSKIESSECKVASVQGYKINIRISGKIKGVTSETQHTQTQIWVKILLQKEKKSFKK